MLKMPSHTFTQANNFRTNYKISIGKQDQWISGEPALDKLAQNVVHWRLDRRKLYSIYIEEQKTLKSNIIQSMAPNETKLSLSRSQTTD